MESSLLFWDILSLRPLWVAERSAYFYSLVPWLDQRLKLVAQYHLSSGAKDCSSCYTGLQHHNGYWQDNFKSVFFGKVAG